jgi:Holliday junction resolvase RusA-like endonuclease
VVTVLQYVLTLSPFDLLGNSPNLFGQIIKEIMTEMPNLHLKQAELAHTIYVSPQSVNSYYISNKKPGKMNISKKGRIFRETVQNELEKMKRGEKLSKVFGTVELFIVFGFKDKRIRDVDNYCKPFIDSIKLSSFIFFSILTDILQGNKNVLLTANLSLKECMLWR